MTTTKWLLIAVVIIILQSIALYTVITMHSKEDEKGAIEATIDSIPPVKLSNTLDPNNKVVSTDNRRDAPKRRYTHFEASSSKEIIVATFGNLPAGDSADLKYRTAQEIRSKYQKVFTELPVEFDSSYKNPCWTNPDGHLECLPYAYVLGFPKCGSSDLFERLKSHPQILMPHRKEVRWFTRGEFSTTRLVREGGLFNSNDTALGGGDFQGEMDMDPRVGHKEELLGPGSSIYSFTSHFSDLAKKLHKFPDLITIDGGPHTIWWPTQMPDGTESPEDIPPSQLVREIQPQAKFIITVSDPVKRMFSDYHFLADDLKPVHKGGSSSKSPQQFHSRVVYVIEKFNECVEYNSRFWSNSQSKEVQFRAAQKCAHDRHRFSVGGYGRLGIGLYALFIEKWLEHFSMDQFKVVKLEDYDKDPTAYMADIFSFLGLQDPRHEEWKKIVGLRHANVHRTEREPMLPETEQLLRNFYKPYNELLASLLNNDGFLWSDDVAKDRNKDSKDKNNDNNNSSNINNPSNNKNRNSIVADRFNHKHGNFDLDDEMSNEAELDEKRRTRGDEPSSKSSLRSRSKFNPKAFDISDLPMSKDGKIAEWLQKGKLGIGASEPMDEEAGAHQLCVAVYALDLPAIKYLLYDIGLDSNHKASADFMRNSYHCLAMLYSMGDAGAKSHVFGLLKGSPTWLTPYINPPLPDLMKTVPARSIIDGLEDAMIKVMAWLDRAGVDHDLKDRRGNTPLHIACIGGEYAIVENLLKRGADPNTLNNDHRTPLHFAAINGHAKILDVLVKYKGDLNLTDENGNSPYSVLQDPGPVSSTDALKYFNIVQRATKKIDRIRNPELRPHDKRGWKHGTGNWSTEALPGFEDELSCDLDQYWAHEIDGDEIFKKYLGHNAPILIRGLIDEWGVSKDYRKEELIKNSGHIVVEISDIPYQKKFGGAGRMDMTIADYIDSESKHKIVGGDYPWYIFRGHPIPHMSESKTSLVNYSRCPTPLSIQKCFSQITKDSRNTEMEAYDVDPLDPDSRGLFINAQWALGGMGTGAPVHYHNTAWNALIYGAKKWYVFPPHSMIMSNKQIKNFVETDLKDIEAAGYHSMSCIQTAGDVMIIPESWGHGVLNIQDSVAVASEAKHSMWRLKPMISFTNNLPFDNRKL